MQTIFVPGARAVSPRPDLRLDRGRPPGSRCTNLAKSYKRRPVLRDVSLTLRRGEVAALLGPNGAGKTTCFYAIAGLVPPDRGTITRRRPGRDLAADVPPRQARASATCRRRRRSSAA